MMHSPDERGGDHVCPDAQNLRCYVLFCAGKPSAPAVTSPVPSLPSATVPRNRPRGDEAKRSFYTSEQAVNQSNKN